MSVVVVGVTGCSASGKTLAAARLAALLHSPIALISMDNFFDSKICATLNTWEDPRCLRAAEFAATIRAVRKQLAHDNNESAHHNGTVQCGSNHEENEDNNRPLSDDSFAAHMAADALIAVHSASLTAVKFIVCEGFLLFAHAAVCEVIDYFVFIDIDNETACLRRFLRAPRHHLNEQRWNARLERMRSQDRPAPPLPSRLGDYEGFWRRAEYMVSSAATSNNNNPKEKGNEKDGDGDTSWMALADPERIAGALQGSSGYVEQAIGTANPYYEFRYWFYYEVLFHHRRHRPIMEQNAAAAAAAKKPLGGRIVWHIANGADVSPEAFEESLRLCAECLWKECGDSPE